MNRELDVYKMNVACAVLFDYVDFTSFSRLHTDVKTNNCKIYFARWVQKDHGVVFTIKADRFLRNMVRAIVGTMVQVGLGKLSIAEFRKIIEAKDRGLAGASAPAQGLSWLTLLTRKMCFNTWKNKITLTVPQFIFEFPSSDILPERIQLSYPLSFYRFLLNPNYI